jgi:3-oxoacyl-[acyl-carrier protein] reductase
VSVADLTGRVVLVVGGTRGIGFASAVRAATEGATVVLTGRDESDAKEKAEEVARRSGASVTGAGLEITDDTAVQTTIRAVAREHGRLDGLVVTAGVLEEALLGMVPAAQVQQILSVNLAGTISALQAGARTMMRKKSGSVVLLGSVVGEDGAPGQSVYAASKAGVVALARSAAKELGPHGIRVNAVAPGVIATDLVAGKSEAVVDRVVAATPLGRLGTADDVAGVITFLLSDAAAFLTGQVIRVDGGLAL